VANLALGQGVSREIPTLSEWGLVAMAVLLVAIAIPFLRRRRAA
jgi:hypothetical protein